MIKNQTIKVVIIIAVLIFFLFGIFGIPQSFTPAGLLAAMQQRIQLGVSEPVIQEHCLGDYQILVQLPGVDDPARVKEIMQSTAMLEIRQAIGGPYNSEQEAMQAHGGILPANAVLLKGKNIGASGQTNQDSYWVISRASALSGNDLRTADASRDENGRPDVKFTLTGEGGKRFA